MGIGIGLFAATAGGASVLQNAGSIAAIIGASIALLLLLVGFSRWYIGRKRRQSVSRLLHEGNELSVSLANAHESQVVEFAALTTELDDWWKRVEEKIRAFRIDLLSVLRSETGRPIYNYSGHSDVYNAYRNWLIQRIGQLEKVLRQL